LQASATHVLRDVAPGGFNGTRLAAVRLIGVDVGFDNTHLLLNLSDGRAVRFPLNWFPVLKLAT
jgi:hypothetical protein